VPEPGLTIVELHDIDQHQAMSELLRQVWGAESADQLINAATLRALAHAGNYVVGGYRGPVMVGAAVGFLGSSGERPDHLHSHITGVLPGGQGRGVGFAIKQHQRQWALRHGLPTIRWTYDPLVSRNGYFNLHKLGAVVTGYLCDFYGPMADGINAGDATDRLYVCWDLASARAEQAATGTLPEPDLAALRSAGAQVWVDRVDGRPVAKPPELAATVLVAVPDDVERLRPSDPDVAAAWRLAVRTALITGLDAGLRVTAITRDGWYVLEEPA
jgi:predicted GNAT superfamily acetyltransferase